MISDVQVFLRNLRRFFSRTEWAIRLLKLPKLKTPTDHHGLVMIQIDGLSLVQFQRALERNRMPYLNSLLQKERYVLHSFYSGIPSNTPAVQGELFYGIKTCVPAFSFVDGDSGEPIRMFDTAYVPKLEEYLKKHGEGLLTGGSSYSNIFTAGADEAHFCFGGMGVCGILHAVNPLVFPLLVLLYLDIFIKTFILLALETVIAVFECLRGTLRGRVFSKELEMIWLRVLVCVLLRELIVAGVCIDIARGLPVIHMNFLGYDEQAHCRGPSSSLAHWSLQGIDYSVKRIGDMIRRSPYRQYDLWVYSDHGQEKTEPYLVKYGETLETAVQRLFGQKTVTPYKDADKTLHRAKLLSRRQASLRPVVPALLSGEVVVTAMGPLGHIYVKRELGVDEMDDFAQRLVKEVRIPLVLIRLGAEQVLAYTRRGKFSWPEDAAEVLGADHPFLEEIREDLLRVCRHPNAGTFILFGWCDGETAISFPIEFGGHAGLGPDETKGFALLPLDAPLAPRERNYVRAGDLRRAAQNILEQKQTFIFTGIPAGTVKTLRIMSYNVHGCRGLDGHISTNRIARVIGRYNPDIVALQELDVGRIRSAGVDQAEKIARNLEMNFHFQPTFRYRDGQYGNAILSRYPMGLIKKDALPRLSLHPRYEPRGALWVVVEYEGIKINILNTHLSLWQQERVGQVNALLSSEWLHHPECRGPLLLCGDFNMTPGSPTFRKICSYLRDSQSILEGHRPHSTWLAHYPMKRRIDHVFVSPEFKVRAIPVMRTALDKFASDHAPLVVELDLPAGIAFEQREVSG